MNKPTTKPAENAPDVNNRGPEADLTAEQALQTPDDQFWGILDASSDITGDSTERVHGTLLQQPAEDEEQAA